MKTSRILTTLAVVALPLALAGPAQAAKPGDYSGNVASIDTRSKFVTLDDGTRFRYANPKGFYITAYLHDYLTEDGQPDCNMRDTGGNDADGQYGSFEEIASQPGAWVDVSVRNGKESYASYYASYAPCDGVITEEDMLFD